MSDRVITSSAWLWWASTAALVLIPPGVAAGLYLRGLDGAALIASLPPMPQGVSADRTEVGWAIMLGLVPLGLGLRLLWLMRGLFGLFRAGSALSDAAAERIGAMGRTLVLLAFVGVLTPTLQILVVTWDEAPGSRQLSVAVSAEAVGLVLAGGLMALIGAALGRGAEAARENAGFV